MDKIEVVIFWFRRDLRLDDNNGLFQALKNSDNVLPLFIFDTNILQYIDNQYDSRISLIFDTITSLKTKLENLGSSLLIEIGKPLEIFIKLLENYSIEAIYSNSDYEPYSKSRDYEIELFCKSNSIKFYQFKDQVIFEKTEIVKKDNSPYTIFTPFMKKWMETIQISDYQSFDNEKFFSNFIKIKPLRSPNIEEIGFKKASYKEPISDFNINAINNYQLNRDYPAIEGTSRASVLLRYGLISIRKLVQKAISINQVYLNELIWREFYMMILWNFPNVENQAFRTEYNYIRWKNNEEHFEKWCNGKTGFPIVDAAMNQLNSTGYMHNRLRMITASFLTRLLLIDWRWGEAWFAKKLMDFDLAANNGGWQWAAGTGCDAAPYFRIFNPEMQTKKFDPKHEFIYKWINNYNPITYINPIIDYKKSRIEALEVYKNCLSKLKNAL